jgi:hypothetical protein
MAYLKHPQHGNRHVGEEEAIELEAQGWTRFPRSAEDKALGAWPVIGARPAPSFVELPVVDAPIKRKPGRPKKVNA